MPRQAPSGKRVSIHTSLPASPLDGQEIRFMADAANGVVWTLRYNAGSASAYKWEFLGGAALYGTNEGTITLNAGTSADGTSVPVPLAGDYEVAYGCTVTHTSGQLVIGIGQAASVMDMFLDALTYTPTSRLGRLPALVAGTTLKLWLVVPAAATATLYRRYVRAAPVRVG